MSRYFVFGQQGTCLHFVACLIRLLHNKDFYNSKPITNNVGLYDHIFGAHAFSETIEAIPGLHQYPEEQWAKKALVEIKKTVTKQHFVIKDADKRYIEYDILPSHYGDQETINFILDNFKDSKIVFIKFNENDRLQISINLFIKVYIQGLLNASVFGALRLRELYKKNPQAIIFDKQRFLKINNEELLSFMNDVANSEITSKKFMQSLEPNSNVLEINFNELSNLDVLLNNLSLFTQRPITDNLKNFANEFLTNQPNLEQLKDMIKQMHNNPVTDFVYENFIKRISELYVEDVFDIFNTYEQHK